MTMSFDEAVATVTAPGQMFSVVETEVLGRPTKVYENALPSLRSLFDLARTREGTFLVYEDERLDFAAVMGQVDAIASMLVEHYGVKKGDRVAIGMRNYPEWITAFAAITSIGAIAVSLNAWWTVEEMHYGLEDSGSSVLIADQERAERAEGAFDTLGVRTVVVRSTGMLPPGADRLEDVLVPGAPMPAVEIDPDDDATILYTSGTTGNPKGAVSTHRAVVHGVLAFGCRAAVNGLTNPPTGDPHPYPTSFILVVPLFHVTGCVAVMLSSWLAGAKLVLMYKWSPERALELIERERITNFVGVPTMSWDLLESPDFADARHVEPAGRRRRWRPGPARAGAPGREQLQQGPPPDRLRHDRDQRLRPGQHRRRLRAQAQQQRPVRAPDGRQDRRARRRAPARRRGRRDLLRRADADPRLLEQAGGHGRDHRRRLALQRRHRPARRRGLHLRRGPGQGHGHPGRREHLLRRGRGRDLRAPRRCTRPPSSASPTSASARSWSPPCCCEPAPTVTAEELQAHVAGEARRLQGARRRSIFVDQQLPRGATGKILKRELRDELLAGG